MAGKPVTKKQHSREDALRKQANKRAEGDRKERIAIAELRYKLMRQVVTWGAIVACLYLGYLSVDALAGKTTTVNALVKALGDFRANEWIGYAIAAVFGGGWLVERKVRRSAIKSMGDQIKKLEQPQAPERMSSGLHPDGRPRKKDLEDA